MHGRPAELTCAQLVEIVTDYLEGRRTIELTGRLREKDLAPDVRDALLDAFRGWRDSG